MMTRLPLLLRIAIGRVTEFMFSSFGSCYRCHISWRVSKNQHFTEYTPSRSCFPLCKTCWAELTIQERLPYYRKLYEQQGNQPSHKWEMIRNAVLLEGNPSIYP